MKDLSTFEYINIKELFLLQVKNLDDLILFNDKVNELLNEEIIKKFLLENKPEKFLEALKTSMISKFEWEQSQKEEIMDLLEKKNSYYQLIFGECIKKWVFHFPKKDLEDILNLIKSWVFEWYNNLYRCFSKELKKVWHRDLWENIYYGIPHKDWVIWYQETLKEINLDMQSIEKINNTHIRKYLLEMIGLSNAWNYNYNDWVKAEINEVNSWLSDDNLVIITPIENYLDSNFIDPEILIFFREKTNTDSKVFWELSKKQYSDDYWMDKVNIFIAEAILGWWEQTYWKFMWKSFPNDMNLRANYGNFIIILKWWINKVFDEYYKMTTKIFNINEKTLLDQRSEIIIDFIEEVIYHEYGHSLFWVQVTEIEEVKATLFYWLYLRDKFITNKQWIDQAEIKKIILTFALEFTRNLSRFKNNRYRKYIYVVQILAYHMLEAWLLIFDSEKQELTIDTTNNLDQKFESFLDKITSVLLNIKQIYENNDRKWELEFTNFYNNNTLNIFEALYKKI